MENTEIRKVSYEEYSEAKLAMRKELETIALQLFPNGRRYVEIYTDYGFGAPVTSEVNWTAIGSVPAEDAVKFAQLLMVAAALASGFKYNGYKVVEE